MASAIVTHFVLIHGVGHGAWCWFKLVALLKNAGQKVTAIDLAAAGRNLERVEDLPTIDDYHRPLYSYLEGLSPDDKIILVGHSYGGYAISCAMERFPKKIAFAVFVSACMVGPHLTSDQIDQWDSDHKPPDFYEDTKMLPVGVGPDAQKILVLGDNFLAHKLYQNSPFEDLQLVYLLRRPSKFFNDTVSKQQLLVSEEKYATVRRAYVIDGSDLTTLVDQQKWMIENTLPEVTYEVTEADHMVMISKPAELCTILLDIAQRLNSN